MKEWVQINRFDLYGHTIQLISNLSISLFDVISVAVRKPKNWLDQTGE
jgi:hypothetical protein